METTERNTPRMVTFSLQATMAAAFGIFGGIRSMPAVYRQGESAWGNQRKRRRAERWRRSNGRTAQRGRCR